jgi:hypothetical protein
MSSDETKLSRRSPISMRPIGRSVSAALALLILAAVGTVFLRGRSTHIPARLESPRTVESADLLELQSKNLAGPEAVDCGRVPVGGDPRVATECALAAQRAGKPFRVRYDIRGIDSFIAVAIVRTPIGTVGTLQYDSDPRGGGGRAHEVVSPKRCPEPVHLWVNPNGRINCFQKESSPPKDVMSPNAEPY